MTSTALHTPPHRRVRRRHHAHWATRHHRRIEFLLGSSIILLVILLFCLARRTHVYSGLTTDATTGLHGAAPLFGMESQVLVAAAQSHIAIDAEYTDPELIAFQERFDAADLNEEWAPVSGEWIAHNGALVQRRHDPYGHSIILQNQRFDEYVLRANIRHMKGIGGGVLFNVQNARNKKNAHLVQFSQSGNGIFWGYFDKKGNFIGQGYERTTPIQDEMHLIEVSVTENTYTIALDGHPVAADIPLEYKGGYIGGFSSNSVVAFDAIQVRPPEGTPESLAYHPAAEVVEAPTPSSKNWAHVNGVIEHRGKKKDQSILSFMSNDSLPEEYSLRVQISLPADTDLSQAAGGLILHAPSKHQKNNAQSIILANAGRDVVWGAYDANGVFQRTGVRILNLDPTKSHTLLVSVDSDSYDIHIDGQEVVLDVPAISRKGWIGFIAEQGPVSFTSFQFTPEQTSA